MRAASLHSPPEAGKDGISAGDEPGHAAPRCDETERALGTGPQRTLEAGAFMSLGETGPRMDAAFDALPIPTIIAYRDGTDLVLNRLARTLLSLGDDERIRSIDDLHSHVALAPQDGEPVESPLSRALTGERVNILAQARMQGDRCLVIDASPIENAGSIIGAICTIRDITERTLDEEMGDDLLGRASHDLRTPLTALKASAQLISRGFERLDEKARQRTLGLLLAQIDKLASRIDEVMDASRIRRGRVDVHAEQIDVTTVLNEVASTVAAMPGMPKCEVIAPDTLKAHGDGARLRQVLKRFVVDAASRGTERIVLETASTGATVTITVDVVGEKVDEGRSRTARRLAATILRRLGGAANLDPAERLVLTLPVSG